MADEKPVPARAAQPIVQETEGPRTASSFVMPSREQVVEFLRAKGAFATTCYSCSSVSWTLGPKVENYMVHHTLQSTMDTTRVGGSIVPTVLMTCINCGLIREHSLVHISDWVRANAPK